MGQWNENREQRSKVFRGLAEKVEDWGKTQKGTQRKVNTKYREGVGIEGAV